MSAVSTNNERPRAPNYDITSRGLRSKVVQNCFWSLLCAKRRPRKNNGYTTGRTDT
jgi:hypothetical protein